jgi:clan AA aspartic protease
VIAGVVNARREAVIPLDVIDAGGQPHRIEAIIDTGFTGFLTLPPSMIATLGLPFLGRQQVILGNGSVDLLDVYTGIVHWDGQDRTVEVDSAGSGPLVGMSLLDGYDLHIQARAGGSVTITALP